MVMMSMTMDTSTPSDDAVPDLLNETPISSTDDNETPLPPDSPSQYPPLEYQNDYSIQEIQSEEIFYSTEYQFLEGITKKYEKFECSIEDFNFTIEIQGNTHLNLFSWYTNHHQNPSHTYFSSDHPQFMLVLYNIGQALFNADTVPPHHTHMLDVPCMPQNAFMTLNPRHGGMYDKPYNTPGFYGSNLRFDDIFRLWLKYSTIEYSTTHQFTPGVTG